MWWPGSTTVLRLKMLNMFKISLQGFPTKMKMFLPQQLFPFRCLPQVTRIIWSLLSLGHSLAGSLSLPTHSAPSLWPCESPTGKQTPLFSLLVLLSVTFLCFWEASWNYLWNINTVRLQVHKCQGEGADGLTPHQCHGVRQAGTRVFISGHQSTTGTHSVVFLPSKTGPDTMSYIQGSINQKSFADMASNIPLFWKLKELIDSFRKHFWMTMC